MDIHEIMPCVPIKSQEFFLEYGSEHIYLVDGRRNTKRSLGWEFTPVGADLELGLDL